MSAPLDHETPKSARLITDEEWARHRREALGAAPEILRGAGIGLPDVLIGYQQRLLQTTATHQVTVVEKSRRTGVTWAAGADAVLTAASERQARGMDVLYIGYNLDMAREFIDTCAMWARVFNSAVTAAGIEDFVFDDGDPDSNIQAFRIRFASGFEVVALASRPRSLRGRQGYVIIDEAAFHDDLVGVLQAALALLIWGGKVLVISTHNGSDNPYNRLLQEIRAGKKPYALLRVDFDEALREGLYERVCLVTGDPWSVDTEAAWRAAIIAFYGEGADEELFCIPAESGGAWLTPPLVEARMQQGLPVIRLKLDNAFTWWPEPHRHAWIDEWCDRELRPLLAGLDPQLRHYFGGDYARFSDLTVFCPLQLLRTMHRRVPFVVELRNVPFDCQARIQSYIIGRLPRFCAADLDATGLGMAMAEAAAQKFGPSRIEQVKLSIDWYREHTQPLKSAFEEGTIIIPADAEHRSDLTAVEVRNGVAQVPGLKTGTKKDRHGDFAIALMMADSASRRHVVAYDYESADSLREADAGDEEDLSIGGRGLW